MVASAEVSNPTLYIFGGPNGSGKSTSVDAAALDRRANDIWIVNPDLLAATIAKKEALDLQTANLQAVKRIEG